jgi:Fe-S-cluster containining protein
MEEGVFYQCQRCANCCRWPGEVPVTESEVVRIAEFLEVPLREFVAEFTDVRINRSGLTLIEKANGECVFLDGRDCRIQPVKPSQCAGFPNQWNFPGWREKCEAIPIPLRRKSDGEGIPECGT